MSVILILGFANFGADGISMGASNVLSRRSSAENVALPTLRSAGRQGMATFLGSVIAGLVPLLAYLLPDTGANRSRRPWGWRSSPSFVADRDGHSSPAAAGSSPASLAYAESFLRGCSISAAPAFNRQAVRGL